MRYLLGTLSEEERTRMEELYFSDDTEFENIEIAEEELIDRYVRGELSREDKSRFEGTLAASPRLTERVRFASVWKNKLASAAVDPVTVKVQPKPSWLATVFGFSPAERPPRWAIAFSCLVVVAFIGLFVGWLKLRENSRRLAGQEAQLEQRQRELDKQLADLKAQRELLAGQASPAPTPVESASPPKPTPESPVSRPVVALSLFPGGTRSGGSSHDLRIASGTKEVQLNLRLRDASYTSYQVTIRSVDGRGGFSADKLQPRNVSGGAVLFVRVPAGQLGLGDYLIRVNGRSSTGATEAVDDYQFRVIK